MGAAGGSGRHGGDPMMTGIGWGMGLLGPLWMVGGLLLVVALAALALRGLGAPGRTAEAAGSGSAGLELLRERYARGDISEAEFEQARRALGYI